MNREEWKIELIIEDMRYSLYTEKDKELFRKLEEDKEPKLFNNK